MTEVNNEIDQAEEIIGIPVDEHSEWTRQYHRRSDELTKLSVRLPVVLAAASGFPLYTNLGEMNSRLLFLVGLALSEISILFEYIRQHLNLRHIEEILTKPEEYKDFHHGHTLFGVWGDRLFWIRGLLLLTSGV